MKRCAPTASGGRRDLRRGGLGTAEGDVLRDGAAEQEPLLRDDPELAAERALRHAAQVVTVDRDPALGRVVEAGDQLRDRRLAAPVWPTSATVVPGQDVELEPVQHLGKLRPVAEADAVEVDVALDPRQLLGVGGSTTCGFSSSTPMILSSAAIAERNVL